MIDFKALQSELRRSGGMNRRIFLAYAASLSSIPLLGSRTASAARRVAFPTDPFQLGIASGDPTPHGVVLWTRLAPRPLEPDGGMPHDDVEVTWEVARDESMQRIVARGTATAARKLSHSLHVEVDGLAPDRWYWYRFRAGDAETPVGRTRTMPPHDATPDRLRFAFASCQHYESGFYTAYEHMAQEELDLVFHLGDYIYEGAAHKGRVRKHIGKELDSLDDYRIRHAQYKTDPLLQAIHALCPWIVTWDDHEVDNNYAADISEERDVDPASFLLRRANAYQAYYEMMPLRRTSLPRGPAMDLYRNLSFGRLADFFVLDTRQYRSDQPDTDDVPGLFNSSDDSCSMLGTRQREWLENSLAQSSSNWNVLAQQVLMGIFDRSPGKKTRYSLDTWCGYTGERRRLLQLLKERSVENTVVLTGDCHSNWVNDLGPDDPMEPGPIVATEFAGTSITSAGNGMHDPELAEAIIAENRGVRFCNWQRGYVRCSVTPGTWQSDYRVVDYVDRPGAPIKTLASFAIESGRPGAQLA